jgi:hypothetical protein
MQPDTTDGGAVVLERSEKPAQTALPIHVKKIPRQRHFLILFFFSFMWGVFGVDRFYMGLIGTGFLKLITLGGFGLWALTDMIVVMTGTFRDKQGRLTLQSDEYKKFAGRTILWFAVVIGLVVLVNGVLLILGIYQLLNSFQDGSFQSQIPGFSDLSGTGDQQSQINSLLGQ